MKNGCAWIIGIIVLIYILGHPDLLKIVGVIVALVVVGGIIAGLNDKKKAAAAAVAKTHADAAFLNSIPDSIRPALSPAPQDAFDPDNLPAMARAMPTMSQNILKYGDNTKALGEHVDYLDRCQSEISSCAQQANTAYGQAIAELERQQADLYRLAHRAAQNVATIETRFPGFTGRLDEVATGWVPPKPPLPSVYSPSDFGKSMKWLKQTPSAQIGGALGRGDWRMALVGTAVTAAIKVIQFQKIVREVSAAHGTVMLSAKKAADQRAELGTAYERVAAISGEVSSRSVTLLELVTWFAAQERTGAFANTALNDDQRRKLIAMASFAHLARGRAAQAA